MREEPISNTPPERDFSQGGDTWEPGSAEDTARSMGEESRESTTGEQGTEAGENFGQRAGEHFKQGAADAAKAVNEFVPKLKSYTEKSIFKGVYGMSFGVNFAGKLVKDVVVENVVKGATEGARAGRDAATQFRKRRRTEAEETVVDVTEVDPGPAMA